ncbi:MAG: undecaprenyldiphospho-muramoylpentapeptide beta-N-acetylglucosaminyltransferase [Oscillospiraceae bacterium]
MNVILAGGGTAGHINPAVAIAQEILKKNPKSKILFVGNKNSMESEIALKNGFYFKDVKVYGFQRSLSLNNIKRNLKSLYYLVSANSKCKKILKDFNPDIVIGTGGYVSGPIVYVASKMGIKTVIHEQNAFPGITTKILSNYVDKVMLTSEQAKNYIKHKEKCVLTGLPIRDNIIFTDEAKSKEKYNVKDRVCLLSFGGSLGAKPLNDAIVKLMKWEKESNKNILHIHATGKKGYNDFIKSLDENGINHKSENFLVLPYIDDMDVCLKACDIVISRAGATTLSEILVAGKASILIPSPYVSENHQYHNAKVLEDENACIIVSEKEIDENINVLINKVDFFIKNENKIKEYGQNASKLSIVDANEKIYEIINKLV